MGHLLHTPRHWLAPLQRARAELIWLIPTVLSAYILISATPSINHPWGSNWPMYFEAARYFWDPSAAYFGWRPPIYPLSLATLGDAFGYVQAAHWIAQASMVVVICAAGLMARLMVGRGAAILAVGSIPLLQCAVEGAMWTNMYPPAAAALTTAAAAAVGLWRRPSIALAILAGLLAGLAWRMNHLGLVAVPLGVGMAVLGATTRLKLLIIPALFCVGVSGAVTVDQAIVEHWNVPQEGLNDQVLQRRREELERIGSGQADPELFSACTDLEPKPLNLSELTNRCGQQFVSVNYGTLRTEDCAPSLPTLLWLLPLALLPSATRRSWRDSAAAVLLFGGPIGAFLVASAWTSYAEKYAISYLGMMVLIVPMAFDRLGGWLGVIADRVTAGRTIGLLAAGWWIASSWPAAAPFTADQPNIKRDWESISGEVAEWSRETLNADDLLIDCVPLSVDLVLLPDRANILEGVSTDRVCRDWIEKPPQSSGAIYLVQQSLPGVDSTQPENIEQRGWTLLRELDAHHRLWRRSH